jgi:hypothetical protein
MLGCVVRSNSSWVPLDPPSSEIQDEVGKTEFNHLLLRLRTERKQREREKERAMNASAAAA